MMGSDVLANIIWTAPTLIGLNYYMLQRISPLIMTKFFALTLASTFIFWSAFNPTTGLNYRIAKHFPGKFDSFANDGSYYRGADQIAQSLIYFALLYNRMWTVSLFFMATDVLYYGPATIGGPAAAVAGAFMFF